MSSDEEVPTNADMDSDNDQIPGSQPQKN